MPQSGHTPGPSLHDLRVHRARVLGGGIGRGARRRRAQEGVGIVDEAAPAARAAEVELAAVVRRMMRGLRGVDGHSAHGVAAVASPGVEWQCASVLHSAHAP
jgi:hypothetical protein